MSPHPMYSAATFFRVLLGSFLATSLLLAQEPANAEDPATIDPADIYFQGWLALRDSEDFAEKDQPDDAFESANKAKRFLDTLALYHPEWKPHLVSRKQEEIQATIDQLAPVLAAKTDDAPELYTESFVSPAKAPQQLSDAQKQEARRLYREIARLKTQLLEARDLRNADVARLQRKLREIEAERNELASSSLQSEIRQLRNRVDLVEDEKRALARTLYQTQQELENAKSRMEELARKEEAARQAANEYASIMKKEAEIATETLTGVRNRLNETQSELEETRQQLLAERRNTSNLQRLLSQARGEIESLTSERDKLLNERDHLASLLKLNEGDRIQKLIEQNMTFARDLREAREQMKALSADADATREDLLLAKRDLAMAKDRIIQLREANQSSQERLLALENKLREAHSELDSRTELADLDSELREENKILREIIEKQLVIQQRRREQGQLLLKSLKEQQNDEAQLALRQLVGEELTLTDEQQLIIDTQRRRSDAEFQLQSGVATREEFEQSGARLRRYITALETAMHKAYSRGKNEFALNLCDDILDEHPGHVPTLVNQGVILLNMGSPGEAIDSFSNAIAMRGTTPIPYAHFMLGVAHHALLDLDSARTEYEVTLKFEPTHAQAHNRLGAVYAQQGDLENARLHFEEAWKYDTTLLDSLSNLSRVYLALGDQARALDHYRRYREAGGSPKPDLEKQFSEVAKTLPTPSSSDGEELPPPPSASITP